MEHSKPEIRSNSRYLLVPAIFIITLALASRLVGFSSCSVEHFDEGVYASNLWFGTEDGGKYPQQHLYAPSLVPTLIRWTMILSGQTAESVSIWPSIAAGFALLVLLWKFASRLFGTTAALIALTLATTSCTHILFSRAALTDGWLLLWFLLALGFFDQATRTQRLADFVWAGASVGLAWWTKYNGWLPLFIAAVAIFGQCLSTFLASRWASDAGQNGTQKKKKKPGADARWLAQSRVLLGWSLSCVIAFVIWSPFLYSLQAHGGYMTVAANHQRYVVGFSGWWSSFGRQIANLVYLGGWFTSDVVSLVLAIAFLASRVASVLGLFGTARTGPGADAVRLAKNDSGVWLVVTAFLLLFAMTPLYTPYLRLMLPWLSMSWLLAGRAGAAAKEWLERWPAFAKCRWVPITLLIGAIALPSLWNSSRCRPDRTGLAIIAAQIREQIGGRSPTQKRLLTPFSPTVVYVYGEPALFFQLRATSDLLAVPIQTVALNPVMPNGVPIPTYLVIGPHARREPSFAMTWADESHRHEFVAKYSYEPSPLVLLDNYDPRTLTGPVHEEIELFRIK